MECKTLTDFGKYLCKFRPPDSENICLSHLSSVSRKFFIEQFNLKSNLNCKKNLQTTADEKGYIIKQIFESDTFL